jgi:hypothetical protein
MASEAAAAIDLVWHRSNPPRGGEAAPVHRYRPGNIGS